MHLTRARRRPLALLPLVLLPLPALAIDDFDRWYVVTLDGQRCGWNHEKQVTADDTITTTTAMNLRIRRGQAELVLDMQSEFVETLDGEPIRSRAEQDEGTSTTTHVLTWTFNGVRIVTTRSGQRSELTRERPGIEWLAPAEAAEYVRSQLATGPDTIQYKSIDPTQGLSLVETTITDMRDRTIEVGGQRVRTTEGRVHVSTAPNLSPRLWMDETGKPVRQEIPLGGLTLTLDLSDEATATQHAEAPEVMASTLIHPNRAIDQPRRTTSGTYILSLTTDGVLRDIPETSVQSVSALSGGRVRVTIDVDEAREADLDDTAPYLQSNQMMDLEDQELHDLLESSLERAGRDPARRAEALRKAVYRHLGEYNLETHFASASEACRARAGDCTEHAVLLAALLRIDGIPSRIVSGLAYAEEFLGEREVFGFHMWTQALLDIDGKQLWVDLDPTMSLSSPFDATHIALLVTPLNDDTFTSDMSLITPLLGALEVEVRRTDR